MNSTIEDAIICERLMVAFGRHRDDRDAEAVGKVLSTDCVWERDGVLIKGREAIRDAVRNMPASLALRHIMTNILINIVGEGKAEGRGYYTVFGHRSTSGDDSLPRPLSGPTRVGDYICHFVREDGNWKISYAGARRVFTN